MRLSNSVKIMLAVVLVLLAVRVALPPVMVWYVNSLLEQQEGISGQVRDIDLALWRGGYVIKQIEINQLNDKGELPLFSAERIDIQLSWAALADGEIVSTMAFHQPVIMAQDRAGQEDITEDAVLDERTWIGLANNLTLFSIDKLSIHDGKIEFNAIAKDVLGELILSQVEGEIVNLHNDAKSELLTEVDFSGMVATQTPFIIQGKFNPNVKLPMFDINLKMDRMPTAETANIIKIYAPFDVEAGEFELATELASDNGRLNGYVKFGIYNLEIFSWKEDVVKDVIEGDENTLQIFVEGVSAMFATLLENSEQNLIATRIPVSGNFSEPDVSRLKALAGLLRNAFIEAYKLNLEDIIDFSSMADEKQEAEKN
ncbi:DUF748 domain-containing protein [Rheinheimera sp. EpRS3]|uniref:DUF748 domain-containing protein n=1 Tax=Rheinheimera sp. EpRS3 TaxID=1712383 RepID=UPI000747DBDB|nr:DUF748 domain-containing protein [Rheinheimera sp. EpRS3]KUM54427.1 hypothetical protein AR688_14005 [Rheinheimera sp. EpRS3]